MNLVVPYGKPMPVTSTVQSLLSHPFLPSHCAFACESERRASPSKGISIAGYLLPCPAILPLKVDSLVTFLSAELGLRCVTLLVVLVHSLSTYQAVCAVIRQFVQLSGSLCSCQAVCAVISQSVEYLFESVDILRRYPLKSQVVGQRRKLFA